MAPSLSLVAYMALARRAPRDRIDFDTDRPDGELVWAHVSSLPRAAAILQLFHRLELLRPGIRLLLTTAPGLPRPDHLKRRVIWQQIPEESVAAIHQFLDHWKPDLCLWTSGHLRPAVIELTARSNVPLYLVDAETAALEDARFRWLPDMSRGILRRFRKILASDAAAAQRLRRIGLSSDDVLSIGALQEGRAALNCDEAARDRLAATLTGRPVWLAAMVQFGEVGIVAQAQRSAMRFAHRQLLILVPDDETRGPQIARQLRDQGWTVAEWSQGDYPEETTQILLADTRGEMGLWYRLSPITFMGSSLLSGYGGRDPYEPAALGSAILYGPNVGRYLSGYSRFSTAGAARIVRDADSLAGAVMQLSAPDQAAAMAHAAWEVSSLGAEVTDAVIEMIQDELDQREAS
ncbi:3-deoxy-D-manno-octulosonic acid transferase [Thalassovita gelatinovora]|uniref:3-deoxy-D-manno-octulosonic acid transferase n=1 Tax=Thalassovita gelatinovora TaxID=53501 RepID=A0A0N7LUG4_THAGE|nr:glycosyltransferase N-terminal domain-containing protein [Thalassovita gelatinovora]QIZ80925.1 3-deoxy-D-manno-octulosonic acid transferase [Thalassovita gelatinovora]CUH63426.1 3-deoxy-D-manno-octulosonic acid transferase [Thalassovita gelatinovora]SEQ66810.1 3-deoxy-D-manno-octulosonic-acid transferase [Thalassovita gelatinovora]